MGIENKKGSNSSMSTALFVFKYKNLLTFKVPATQKD